MAEYRTVTTATDRGAYVSRLVLDLPYDVADAGDLADAFAVRADGEDVAVLRAWACDERGARRPGGSHVALELPEVRATQRIGGGGMGSRELMPVFHVAQRRALAAKNPSAGALEGLVFDESAGDTCPDLLGWDLTGEGDFDGYHMRLSLFTPECARGNRAPRPRSVPLLLWLHGAGEPRVPFLTVMANRVTALGQPDIQAKLGGAAYVLAPSSPTYWMDSGSGRMEDDNQSRYVRALGDMVRRAVAALPAVDPSRVYVGGLSNGGFMTCRLLADYPDLFAAGIAVCPAWNDDLATEAEVAAIARTPLWLVQSADDDIVDPRRTSIPTYRHLRRLGADVHLTLFDHVDDLTGRYHDASGAPLRYRGHFCWVEVYHDFVDVDADGSPVTVGGRPVSLWEWVGLQRR